MGLSTLLGPLGGPPDPSKTSGWTFQPLPYLRVGFPTPPRLLGGPSDLTRMFWWDSRPLRTYGWAYRLLLDIRVGLPSPPRPSGGHTEPSHGPPDLYRTTGCVSQPSRTTVWVSHISWTLGWASRPLPDLWVGIPTPPIPLGGPSDPSWTSVWDFRPIPDLRLGLPDLLVGFPTPH